METLISAYHLLLLSLMMLIRRKLFECETSYLFISKWIVHFLPNANGAICIMVAATVSRPVFVTVGAKTYNPNGNTE